MGAARIIGSMPTPDRRASAPIGYYWGDDTDSIERRGRLACRAGPDGEPPSAGTRRATTATLIGERVATAPCSAEVRSHRR